MLEDASCRDKAYTLLVRLIKHAPKEAEPLLAAFFLSLRSSSIGVRRSALDNAHHFFLASSEHANDIISRVFSAGSVCPADAHTALAKILQRVHLT